MDAAEELTVFAIARTTMERLAEYGKVLDENHRMRVVLPLSFLPYPASTIKQDILLVFKLFQSRKYGELMRKYFADIEVDGYCEELMVAYVDTAMFVAPKDYYFGQKYMDAANRVDIAQQSNESPSPDDLQLLILGKENGDLAQVTQVAKTVDRYREKLLKEFRKQSQEPVDQDLALAKAALSDNLKKRKGKGEIPNTGCALIVGLAAGAAGGAVGLLNLI